MGEIIMPTELTAENGAKTAFLGEFSEYINVVCFECWPLDEPDPNCELCQGNGSYSERVAVSWTNIKAIYKKAVTLFGQTI